MLLLYDIFSNFILVFNSIVECEVLMSVSLLLLVLSSLFIGGGSVVQSGHEN